MKMTAALREHTSSALQSINLSGNPIEDKGGFLYIMWYKHGIVLYLEPSGNFTVCLSQFCHLAKGVAEVE